MNYEESLEWYAWSTSKYFEKQIEGLMKLRETKGKYSYNRITKAIEHYQKALDLLRLVDSIEGIYCNRKEENMIPKDCSTYCYHKKDLVTQDNLCWKDGISSCISLESEEDSCPYKKEKVIPTTLRCNICNRNEDPTAEYVRDEFWLCPECLSRLRTLLYPKDNRPGCIMQFHD